MAAKMPVDGIFASGAAFFLAMLEVLPPRPAHLMRGLKVGRDLVPAPAVVGFFGAAVPPRLNE